MNIQNLLKQAQKMQKEVGKIQSQLNEKIYENSIGGGVVKVLMKGNLTLECVSIDESLLVKESKEDLEDMLVSCINDVIKQANDEKDALMKNVTGGVKLPGGF